MKNIQNLISHKKGFNHFRRQTILPTERHVAPKNSFSLFPENTVFLIKKTLLFNFSYRFYYLSSSCFIEQFLYLIFSTNSCIIYVNFLLFTRIPLSSTDLTFFVYRLVLCCLQTCPLSSTDLSFVIYTLVFPHLQTCPSSSTCLSFIIYRLVLRHLQNVPPPLTMLFLKYLSRMYFQISMHYRFHFFKN